MDRAFRLFLRSFAGDTANEFELAFGQVSEGTLPLELTLDQLPKRMLVSGKTFGLEYRCVNPRTLSRSSS
jgi:hypothetical protein